MNPNPLANLQEAGPLPDHILIEETISKFGIDPRRLKPNSCRLVITNCNLCGKPRDKDFRSAVKQRRCLPCSNRAITQTKSFQKKHSERMKAHYASGGKHPTKGIGHTEHSKRRMSATQKARIRLPLSEATKRKYSETCLRILNSPENQEKARQATKLLRGKNSPHYGRTPSHAKKVWMTGPTGQRICFRSTWEAIFAYHLTASKIPWQYEPQAFPIHYLLKGNQKEGTYTPDFKTPSSWFEVKGRLTEEGKAKIEAFRLQFPQELLTIVDRAYLHQLQILQLHNLFRRKFIRIMSIDADQIFTKLPHENNTTN